MEYFVEKGWIDPQLPEERKIYADKMYAASVYSAGDELSSSSNGFEMQYARALRSTYSPPNRDALSGPLLDDVHDDVKAQVDARLEAAEFLIAVFDMWEDVNGQDVTNLILLTEKGEAIFVDSWTGGLERKTADALTTLFESALKPYEAKLIAVMADTENKMQALEGNLYQSLTPAVLPILLTLLCGAHSLSSCFLKKVFVQIEYFYDARENCKTINHFFLQHHLPHSLFERQRVADKAATGGKVRALENPIKQRWGSSVTAVESTTFNKLHLRRCLDLPAWSEQVERQSHSRAAREEAVALVKSNDVFTSFDVTVNIFSSIVKLIGWIESDNPRFHKVWPRFKEEQANLKATIPSSLKSRVRTNEKEAFAGSPVSVLKHVDQLFVDAWDHFHDDTMVLAYMLDPANKAPNMNDYERQCCLKSLKELTNDGGEYKKVLGEWTNFIGKAGTFKFGFTAEVLEACTDQLAWWAAWGSDAPILTNIARALLSLPSSSAAAERNWSTYGLIHSKLRNRLSPDRLKKLVYIYFNLRALAKVPEVVAQPVF